MAKNVANLAKNVVKNAEIAAYFAKNGAKNANIAAYFAKNGAKFAEIMAKFAEIAAKRADTQVCPYGADIIRRILLTTRQNISIFVPICHTPSPRCIPELA